MNSEELKKKILNEINKHQLFGGRFGYKGELLKFPNELLANLLSELLIAAGIGDVKEAEHRAVKAERALVMSCANMVKDKKSDVNIEWVIRVLYYKYLKQAEKELAEERKDD